MGYAVTNGFLILLAHDVRSAGRMEACLTRLLVMQQTLPSYRQKAAQEAYEATQEMLTQNYLIDTALAYMQSPSFFLWWFGTAGLIIGYKIWKKINETNS